MYIKEARMAAKMTQQYVADFLNIERTSYARYESGAREPDSETLIKLSKLFNVSIDFLTTGAESSQGKNEDSDTWALRQRLREDPDFRMLFSAAEKATPEHIRAAAAMLKALTPEDNE